MFIHHGNGNLGIASGRAQDPSNRHWRRQAEHSPTQAQAGQTQSALGADHPPSPGRHENHLHLQLDIHRQSGDESHRLSAETR
jgi:hypothetical protein